MQVRHGEKGIVAAAVCAAYFRQAPLKEAVRALATCALPRSRFKPPPTQPAHPAVQACDAGYDVAWPATAPGELCASARLS